MDLNFFNTRRKAYEDEQNRLAQGDDEKMQEPEDMDETKTPSMIDRAINYFRPKNNVHPTTIETPTRLEDIYIKEEPAAAAASASQSPRILDTNDNIGETIKPWKKMIRIEKREWALANMGDGAADVQYNEDEIDAMLVPQLNDIYASVILARRQILANTKQI
jgi:hypothetical protein